MNAKTTTTIPSKKLKCDKGFWGYNCLKCQQTCDSGVTNFANYEKTDSCRKQMCPCPDNDHAFQEPEWRTTSVMTRTTLLEMKAEYESLHGKTMTNEQLLAECLNDLNDTKGKILNLLKQVGDRTRLLESTAIMFAILCCSNSGSGRGSSCSGCGGSK